MIEDVPCDFHQQRKHRANSSPRRPSAHGDGVNPVCQRSPEGTPPVNRSAPRPHSRLSGAPTTPRRLGLPLAVIRAPTTVPHAPAH